MTTSSTLAPLVLAAATAFAGSASAQKVKAPVPRIHVQPHVSAPQPAPKELCQIGTPKADGEMTSAADCMRAANNTQNTPGVRPTDSIKVLGTKKVSPAEVKAMNERIQATQSKRIFDENSRELIDQEQALMNARGTAPTTREEAFTKLEQELGLTLTPADRARIMEDIQRYIKGEPQRALDVTSPVFSAETITPGPHDHAIAKDLLTVSPRTTREVDNLLTPDAKARASIAAIFGDTNSYPPSDQSKRTYCRDITFESGQTIRYCHKP